MKNGSQLQLSKSSKGSVFFLLGKKILYATWESVFRHHFLIFLLNAEQNVLFVLKNRYVQIYPCESHAFIERHENICMSVKSPLVYLK